MTGNPSRILFSSVDSSTAGDGSMTNTAINADTQVNWEGRSSKCSVLTYNAHERPRNHSKKTKQRGHGSGRSGRSTMVTERLQTQSTLYMGILAVVTEVSKTLPRPIHSSHGVGWPQFNRRAVGKSRARVQASCTKWTYEY